MQLITPYRINSNVLLEGADKTLTLQEALLYKMLFDVASGLGGSKAANMAKVSEEQLKGVHERYGESGLFKLSYMASGHSSGEFDHFFELIADELAVAGISEGEEQLELDYDNHSLPESEALSRVGVNVLQPSLARKLYNPGRHPGYLVYGLGGPKILVSHPFRSITAETYDVYNNTIELVTSLWMRGFMGSFLFLDYLPGLNYEVRGIPAWLVWFAVIAAHSDLVLYIQVDEGGMSPSQLKETEFTPNRVQKKIVEIPRQELTWEKKPDLDDVEILYITGEKGSTREDFYKKEREHAEQLINLYAQTDYPQDRLFRIDESGNFSEYPLDYPIYGEG